MRPFVHDDFLLETELAADIYHGFAEGLPIIDYHSHLAPDQIRRDHRFRSLTELWLDADHYKWRAMRTHGVPERLCTGEATDWERFEAWAATVPHTLRNPLFHWTHMELRRPFGITRLLDPASARSIYDGCNDQLAGEGLTARGLLRRFRVAVACTTDDPTDTLEHHIALQQERALDTRVYPTWRPDRALAVEDPQAFNAWVNDLEAAANTSVTSVQSFLDALEQRHAFFHTVGCRLSDHGIEQVDALECGDRRLAALFDRARSGALLPPEDAFQYRCAMLHRLALMDHARGWVQQLHLGVMRNVNSRLFRQLGPDRGFDTISDAELGRPLARFLDLLDRTDQLAPTILYNLNPRDNALVVALIGCFQDGSMPGKLQCGPAWWFLDQRDGIEAQLETLSNLGLLSRFVGMVTDSRSFLSFSRHDYFRRLLCNLLGDDARRGLVPEDRETLGSLVRALCFGNARDYFGFELGAVGASSESSP